MLSLRATARATVEAHSLRGNTTTQAFSYATPSLQRKQPSIQQKQKSLQHNRRHANQRSFREFLFSPQGLLCQYLPCSPENQLYHVKHPRRDRSASDVGTSNNVGKRNVIDASNDYGAWHENGGPAVDIPKRLHFYGLAEVVRGCIQSCLSPARLQHASAVGDILPINTSNDANDVNDQNMSKDGDKVDETTRKVYPSIAESLLWVEGDAGVYKRCLTSLVKKEVEAQLGKNIYIYIYIYIICNKRVIFVLHTIKVSSRHSDEKRKALNVDEKSCVSAGKRPYDNWRKKKQLPQLVRLQVDRLLLPAPHLYQDYPLSQRLR